MKKVLVTGAAGFIGSHLVDALIARNITVRCLVRKNDDLQFLPKDRVQIVFGDVTDKNSLKGIVDGVDVIYHLAARTDFEGNNWTEYYQPNVLGTQNLIDLAIKKRAKRFVFFSTMRVVGLRDSKEPIDESAPCNPLNFYDRSKSEAEERLLTAYQKFDLPVTILRPSSVYGPRGRGTYLSFFKTIAKGRFFLVGSGENQISFVFVKNLVDAAILAAYKKEAVGQTYFISDARPYTMVELSRTIGLNFGRKIPPWYLPIPLGYIAGYSFLLLGKVFGFVPPLTPERVKNLTISYVFDISKARRELGYQPKVNLETGIKETVLWYKKNGWV